MSTTQWDFLTGDPDRDQRNVRILLDSVEQLYGPQPLDELMRSAVDRAIEVTGAERGILLLADEEGVLRAQVSRSADGRDLPLEERYSHTVVNKVWTSGEASLTMDTADEHEGDLSESILSLRLLSVMGVPMPFKGSSIGVLYVDSTAKVKEFTTSDFSVFQALGGLIALAVQNAQLMAEKETQERMKRELLAAQEIQRRLLPTDLPQPQGFDLAGYNRPCDETSGDYYDVIPFGDDLFALVIGDVAGHGLPSALIMASARALLHSSLLTHPDALEVMHSVNRFLERDIPTNRFMTLFLGALDPAKRTLQYVSAGHNPPLLLRGDSIEEMPLTGTVLGVMADAPYTQSQPRTLQTGDVIILYTDGIYEAKDAADEMYGERRFRASFQEHASNGHDADGVLQAVLDDLMAFVGDQPLDDDVTCLVVRVV